MFKNNIRTYLEMMTGVPIILGGMIFLILLVLPAEAHVLTIMAYNINYTNLDRTEVHTRLTGGPPLEEILPELEQQRDKFQMSVDGKSCLPLQRENTIFFFSCPLGAELVVEDSIDYSRMNQTVIITSTLFFTTFRGKTGDVVDGTKRNVFALPPELFPEQMNIIDDNSLIIEKDIKTKVNYLPKIAGGLAALVFLIITIYFFRRSKEKNNGEKTGEKQHG